ncbi:murein transglycosylase A [Gynuella sunshinyii]|uniref:Membrane-bound lytic murein transglycosylase A n=1 Tax=Gynuella sunshinyii YC6258 TaxID=1445510 RepID=A0A0C5VTP5_9GAMM|nr:murein transglycosylase A [Gynuella sunshinyii]AJQ97556.1 membrane-bound lytic murein transglycosylase [Gynuella sunshinyii YC6258]
MHLIHRFLIIALSMTLLSCSLREIDSSNDFAGNGRDTQVRRQSELYRPSPPWPTWSQPSADLLQGLKLQQSFLSRPSVEDHYVLGNLEVTRQQLQLSAERLSQWLQNPQQAPGLNLYQLQGDDKRGNVQFTGYYVPVMKVRHTADDIYKYPLYRKPTEAEFKRPLPDRQAIDFEGALDGLGLEIAYSASLIDNFFLQVQGSGVVEFEDGSRRLLSWGGGNGHAYKSLGKILIKNGEIAKERISSRTIKDWLLANPGRQRQVLSQNPSYPFFSEGQDSPVGAANVALTAGHSIAVDPAVIPLGSVLLGLIPILDSHGDLIRHEYRFLLAQDKGAAINGAGHIDMYFGIGEEAYQQANALKHYGKVWLLLPGETPLDVAP